MLHNFKNEIEHITVQQVSVNVETNPVKQNCHKVKWSTPQQSRVHDRVSFGQRTSTPVLSDPGLESV